MRAMLSALWVLCACGAQAIDLSEPEALRAARPKMAAAALHVSDAQTPRWKKAYALGTPELWFAVDVPARVAGHHTATVFVTMPGGGSYARYDVPFATTAEADVASGEQQADRVPGRGFRVWVWMPVAGTIIEQYQLTGAWSAEVWLDDAASPGASVDFRLE